MLNLYLIAICHIQLCNHKRLLIKMIEEIEITIVPSGEKAEILFS